MRVISNRQLVEFSALHPAAAEPLQAWRKALETQEFPHHAALRATFGSVDKVAEFHVFDIGGNKWRVITFIHFSAHICYIKHVFTHKEYDQWKP